MFYEQLSRYYDRVFPLNSDAVDFIADRVPVGSSIADAACGTGTLSLALAQRGYTCKASDLEPTMISQAQQKDEGRRVEFFVDDMLNVHEWGQFDAVVCLGNSLSHLPDRRAVELFLTNARKALKPDGILVVQIVNYDRIMGLDSSGTNLPTLGDDQVVFYRRYVPQNTDSVTFRSWLHVGEHVYENEIELLPIFERQLQEMAKEVGLTLTCYGDYRGAEFDHTSSFSLICCAKAVDPK